MERRFAVGDKVRVKRDIDPEKLRNASPMFRHDMDQYVGTAMTVTYNGYPSDRVWTIPGAWNWHVDWLELVTPDDGIQAIRDAVTKAVATSTPAQVLAAASALGLKVEQTTTYRIV